MRPTGRRTAPMGGMTWPEGGMTWPTGALTRPSGGSVRTLVRVLRPAGGPVRLSGGSTWLSGRFPWPAGSLPWPSGGLARLAGEVGRLPGGAPRPAAPARYLPGTPQPPPGRRGLPDRTGHRRRRRPRCSLLPRRWADGARAHVSSRSKWTDCLSRDSEEASPSSCSCLPYPVRVALRQPQFPPSFATSRRAVRPPGGCMPPGRAHVKGGRTP